VYNSFRAVSERLDTVHPARTLRELYVQHRGIGPGVGFRDIIRRHQESEISAVHFLFLNTFLMDIAIDVFDLTRASKPRTDERAGEIGEYLAPRWGLICLAEVWRTNVMEKVLAGWSEIPDHAHRITKYMIGDKPRDIRKKNAGSTGLLTVSSQIPISDWGYEIYDNESGRDKIAGKGVLRTQLSPIPGRTFQLYSTHLQAGNTIVALKQLMQLASYVLRTRSLTEPGLIVGDFNIDAFNEESFRTQNVIEGSRDAHPTVIRAVVETVENGSFTGLTVSEKTGYRILADVMAAIGFYDLWSARNGTPGYTSGILNRWSSQLVCPSDPIDSGLCDDEVLPYYDLARRKSDVEEKMPKRIDFVFASEPRAADRLRLTFTRPRRPRHERPSDAPGFEDIKFLSDHLGISTQIILSET
jgi:endonuclease/exonuclease/phosphatase family metal-dependent hydrolase